MSNKVTYYRTILVENEAHKKRHNIKTTMKNKSFVSIDDFTKEEIIEILDMAEEFEKQPIRDY